MVDAGLLVELAREPRVEEVEEEREPAAADQPFVAPFWLVLPGAVA